MTSDLNEILHELRIAVTHDDFPDLCREIIARIRGLPDSFEAVQPILRIMEEYPDVDFGIPGPLVHFVETFYGKGYEEELLESLARRPTTHTVWMLNRIINAVEGDTKDRLLKVLDGILARTDLEEDIVALAQDFREMHEE